MALCTQTDVEQRLHIDFGNPSEPVIASLIAAATGHIQRVFGGPIESTAYTGEKHTARVGLIILLDHVPVTAVSAVTVDGIALTVPADISWTPIGALRRLSSGYTREWGSSKVDGVLVTYTAGFAVVPGDIKDVCAWMVANAFRVGVANVVGALEGIKAENLGEYGVEFFGSVADPAAFVHMTDEQRQTVREHRRKFPVFA